MKRIPYLAKCSLVAALAAIIFISSLPIYGQSEQPAAADRQFNLLVLGDSIPWGQGLRDEHKAWYLVKTWLEEHQRTAGARDDRSPLWGRNRFGGRLCRESRSAAGWRSESRSAECKRSDR